MPPEQSRVSEKGPIMDGELAKLHIFITKHFDLEELRDLCFYLKLDYDDLRGDQRTAKARELILLLARQNRLESVLVLLQRSNPRAWANSGFTLEPEWIDQLYAEFAAFAGSDNEMPASAPVNQLRPNQSPAAVVEAASIPLLVKAVEALFNECKQFLRAREDGRGELRLETVNSDTVAATEATIDDSRAALALVVDERMWQAERSEIEHLLNLLSIQKRNYHQAKEQKEIWGAALVPPHILHNYAEAENGIVETTRRLQATLGKIYGKLFDIGI